MKQLILKDFRANWQYLLMSFCVLFTISTLFIYSMLEYQGRADPDLILYFLQVMMTSIFFSLLFFKVDEMYNTNEIFVSLPVSRSQIVKARYVNTVVYVFIAIIIHFAGSQFGIFIHNGSQNSELILLYNPSLWGFVFLSALIIGAYSMPFYFKFGINKGVLVVFVIHFLFVVFVITLIINMNGLWSDVQKALMSIIKISNTILIYSYISIVMLVVLISTLISVKIYKNKEI